MYQASTHTRYPTEETVMYVYRNNLRIPTLKITVNYDVIFIRSPGQCIACLDMEQRQKSWF